MSIDTNTEVVRAMTTNPVTVYPDTSVDQVKSIFDQNNFRHLPVVDRKGRLRGIISKEDFYSVAYVISRQTSGKIFSEKWYGGSRAKDIMTECPIDLAPEDTIGLAADIFMANDFHALPITDEGKLVGILTTQDLLRFAFATKAVSD